LLWLKRNELNTGINFNGEVKHGLYASVHIEAVIPLNRSPNPQNTFSLYVYASAPTVIGFTARIYIALVRR